MEWTLEVMSNLLDEDEKEMERAGLRRPGCCSSHPFPVA